MLLPLVATLRKHVGLRGRKKLILPNLPNRSRARFHRGWHHPVRYFLTLCERSKAVYPAEVVVADDRKSLVGERSYAAHELGRHCARLPR